MSESTDLRVVGAMIDILEGVVIYHAADLNDTIDRLSTILIEGTSIRIDKRREIVEFVRERYWQEQTEDHPSNTGELDDA